MPIFEYKCPTCDKTRDALHLRYTQLVIPICADCKKAMERVPSAPAFTISGFNAGNGYSGK